MKFHNIPTLLVCAAIAVPTVTVAQTVKPAQRHTSFTAFVKKHTAGEGRVTITQDSLIDCVVNNTPAGAAHRDKAMQAPAPGNTKQNAGGEQTAPGQRAVDKKSTSTDNGGQHSKAADTANPKPSTIPTATGGSLEGKTVTSGTTTPTLRRERYRASGYRIQIFTGSNSHQDKAKAYSIGERCQQRFPELSIYPRFVSPRWICRVGDFKTHEDAAAYVRKIKAAHISAEVSIVKCEVLLAH